MCGSLRGEERAAMLTEEGTEVMLGNKSACLCIAVCPYGELEELSGDTTSDALLSAEVTGGHRSV